MIFKLEIKVLPGEPLHSIATRTIIMQAYRAELNGGMQFL